METEGLAFGFVLYVDVLQLLVHDFGKRLRLLLVDLLVLELEIEMVLTLLHLCETDEELRLDSRLCLGLMYRVHKLRFVQLLAGHGDDAVDFRDHVYGRGVLVEAADLYEVVHVVSEESRVGRHVRAVALAELQLVDLLEMLMRAVQLALLHKLVVMELREKDGLVGVVQRETEPALGRYITELLIEGLVPIKLVHVLVHVDLRVAAFPGTEVLQPRPEIFRVQVSLLGENLPQFSGSLRMRSDVRV